MKAIYDVSFFQRGKDGLQEGEVEVDIPIPHGQNPNLVIMAKMIEKYGEGICLTGCLIRSTPELRSYFSSS